MTNVDWWARVVRAHTQRADLLPQRVRSPRKDGYDATVDLRAVPGGAGPVARRDGPSTRR